MKRLAKAVLAFIGRVGAAIRNLLFWLVWEPLSLFVALPLQYLWRGMGWLGIQLRRLLTALWQPIKWVWQNIFWPLWAWLALGLHKSIRWLAEKIRVVASWFWRKTAVPRTRFLRRFKSHWMIWRARWRVFVRRPRPPDSAQFAPVLPLPANIKMVRASTALISVAMVLILGFASMQEPQAQAADPIVIIATPSPLPPTLTPTPTPEILITPWPTPDPLNEGGTLAFDMRQNGNTDIYILPIGQPDPIRLTGHSAPDVQPVWSPDGTELAFSSKRNGNWEVYVYNLPERRLRRITNNIGYDGDASWSPDGQWLVYSAYVAYEDPDTEETIANLDVYIVKADLSEGPYRITTNPAPDYAPVWSGGSGRHIAFTSWRAGNADIWLMSLDAVSDERAINITQSPEQAEDGARFSPNGSQIAFFESSTGYDLIYSANLAQDMTLATEPETLGLQGRHPAWSPTGDALFYVYEQAGLHYLVASSPTAWGIAPQAYVSAGEIGWPSWTAVSLDTALAQTLQTIDPIAEDQPLFRETTSQTESGAPVLLRQLPVNAPSPYLSDRVDQSFLALRERIIVETGWDFLGQLDEMFVAQDVLSLPSLPAQNWNQTGRAFDITVQDALAFDPRLEIVREDLGPNTYWRIYIRANKQDGTQGEPLRQLPWDFRARFGEDPRYFDAGGKLKDEIPQGYYVDFTALAADYGWERIPANPNWRTYFPGINFWQFEKRDGLSWQAGMLEIYTADELGE